MILKQLIKKYKEKNHLQSIHFDTRGNVFVTEFSDKEDHQLTLPEGTQIDIFSSKVLRDINDYHHRYTLCMQSIHKTLAMLINQFMRNDRRLLVLKMTEDQIRWRKLLFILLIKLIIVLEKIAQRQSSTDHLHSRINDVKTYLSIYYDTALSEVQKDTLRRESTMLSAFLETTEQIHHDIERSNNCRVKGLSKIFNTRINQDKTNTTLPSNPQTHRRLTRLKQKINLRTIAKCIVIGIAISSLAIILTHGIILPPLLAAGIELLDGALIVGLSGVASALLGTLKNRIKAGKRWQTIAHERSDYVKIDYKHAYFGQPESISSKDLQESDLLNAHASACVQV